METGTADLGHEEVAEPRDDGPTAGGPGRRGPTGDAQQWLAPSSVFPGLLRFTGRHNVVTSNEALDRSGRAVSSHLSGPQRMAQADGRALFVGGCLCGPGRVL